jgi:hypothetical protein
MELEGAMKFKRQHMSVSARARVERTILDAWRAVMTNKNSSAVL